MTRILRMMGANEALQLIQGKSTESHLVHAALGNHTDSVGHCFAIDNTENTNPKAIYTLARRVSGISTIEVCLVGIVNAGEPGPFLQGSGQYNLGTPEEPEIGNLPEMSATRYSLADFEKWWMYTPEPIPYHQAFKIISSINWQQPVLSASSIVKH